MRAQEFISELFKGKKTWSWDFNGSEEAYATFEVGDIPYKFVAYTDPNNWGTWEVEFSVISPSRNRSTKFGLTGTGNAAEVMSTVTDILREFLERYKGNVNRLIFTADEPSRQRLYARMVKRLLPNWTLTTSNKQFIVTSPDISENFADGKNPGRKGLAKRSGVNTNASVSSLRKTAKNSSGEKARMAHWLANMKAGRAKKNK
jgi:hypothetical protein